MTRAEQEAFEIGQAAVALSRSAQKAAAAAPELSYGLKGKLYLSKNGWLMLQVPNSLGRGAFDALHEPGAELPVSDSYGAYNAHVSVVRPEEFEEAGLDPEKVTERGHDVSYTTGEVRTVVPDGWDGVSRVWFIIIRSPELEAIRKSYGLPALPQKNGESFQFHCTFAIRRRNVLRDSDVTKGRQQQSLIHQPGLFADQFQRKTAAMIERQESDIDLLRHAKAHSDRKQYKAKSQILRRMMEDAPDDWMVDTPLGQFYGITHIPTNFKFHAPPAIIPAYVKRAALPPREVYSVLDEIEKEAGLRADLLDAILKAREATDTNPTEEQKKAGNYKKGRFSLHGLQIALENPKGSIRSGIDKSGKPWSSTMAADYGYICGPGAKQKGADGDAIDIFIGDRPESHMIFVVDQVDPETGKFDEHKAVAGVNTKLEAEQLYRSCYDKGWKGFGGIHSMHLYGFKRWLSGGDTTQPAVGQQIPKAAADSFYLKALETTPITTNLPAYIGTAKATGDRWINEATTHQRFQAASDPNWAARHLQALLARREDLREQPVSHPVDQILRGEYAFSG